MANKKTTKKEFYAALREMVEGVDMVGEYPADKVLEFIDTQVAQLEAKATKAAEAAAKKRAAGDQLRAEVLALITTQYQNADEITEALGRDDISRPKVIARLTQLVRAGEIVKEQIKGEDGRKVMHYKRLEVVPA